MTSSTTYDIVNTHYSSLAREKPIKNSAHIDKVALSFGYNAEDLAAIPDGANLGVSCGNPIALAGLKEVS
jgi:arsenite methyltransferase